jgi:ketosteroid isomerase-like protein
MSRELQGDRTPTGDRETLIALAHDWDGAMLRNDADEIGRYMAEDWMIIGTDGRIADRKTFLGLIASGTLTHDAMESQDIEVRVYGDAAVLVARGVSSGRYQGHLFREYERQSNVFVRSEGQWRCVLTHLSRLSDDAAQ